MNLGRKLLINHILGATKNMGDMVAMLRLANVTHEELSHPSFFGPEPEMLIEIEKLYLTCMLTEQAPEPTKRARI